MERRNFDVDEKGGGGKRVDQLIDLHTIRNGKVVARDRWQSV